MKTFFRPRRDHVREELWCQGIRARAGLTKSNKNDENKVRKVFAIIGILDRHSLQMEAPCEGTLQICVCTLDALKVIFRHLWPAASCLCKPCNNQFEMFQLLISSCCIEDLYLSLSAPLKVWSFPKNISIFPVDFVILTLTHCLNFFSVIIRQRQSPLSMSKAFILHSVVICENISIRYFFMNSIAHPSAWIQNVCSLGSYLWQGIFTCR